VSRLITGTKRQFNQNSDQNWFCQYHKIKFTIQETICICVRVCMEREKERQEPACESQSHNDSNGISESENKRQEKTLKVICFIEEIKNGEDTLTKKVCYHAPRPRSNHERGRSTNKMV